MRLRTRTIAVASATLLTVGGVAYAFVPAAKVTGEATVSLDPGAARLDLTVDKTGLAVIGHGTVYLDILALNRTDATLALPAGSLPAPGLTVFKAPGVKGVCNQASFVAGVPTHYTDAVLDPGETAVVAQVPVTFQDLPEPQNACIKATLVFSWPKTTIG